MELVSIIVPIYNVQVFLLECLNSIANQSYKNIEILLIDDGSTDDSSSIASSYVKKDARFKYFRKENGGLSSARNYGIERATGSWLMFIDSDDIVSPLFVEHMLNLVLKTKTSLGICLYKRFKASGEIDESDIYNSCEYKVADYMKLYELIDTPVMMLAWNKIYKSNLFIDVRYPEGKIHEDLGTTYKIFDKLDKYSFFDEKLYFYRINKDSISLSKISIRKLDVIDFYLDQLLFYKCKYETSKEYYLFYKFASLRFFKIFGTLLSYKKIRYENYNSFKRSVNLSFKKNYKIILQSKIGLGRKLVMFLSCHKVTLLATLSKIKQRIRG